VSNESDNINCDPRLGFVAGQEPASEEIHGQDLVIVLSQYDIGKIDRLSDYKKGSRRAAKMLIHASKGSYLLKRRATSRDAKQQVKVAHAVQQHLSHHRFPVAGLIETLEGHTFVEHDGRIYELFKYIKGKRFDKTNPAAAEAGRVLAHFHDLLRDFPVDQVLKRPSYHQGDSIIRVLDEIMQVLQTKESSDTLEGVPETIEYLKKQYAIANQIIDDVDFNSLPSGIVHADWHPGNMLYKDGEIIAVIDFDSIRVNPRITDIANGALQFSMRMGETEDVQLWKEGFRGQTIRSMIQAYEHFTQLPLMASERTIVPYLMVEALIVESIIPIHSTGSFGTILGSSFLKMVEGKLRWLDPRMQRITEVIRPPSSGEDTF